MVYQSSRKSDVGSLSSGFSVYIYLLTLRHYQRLVKKQNYCFVHKINRSKYTISYDINNYITVKLTDIFYYLIGNEYANNGLNNININI